MNTPNKKLPTPEQVIVTSMEYAGFRAMQVCVLPTVTDEEILAHCNATNPQLTIQGWHIVVKSIEHAKECNVDIQAAPGNCLDCPGRLHKIVLCL